MSSPVKIRDAIVIGAGLAGLTAAFVFRQHKIDTLVIDKDDGVGGSWAKRHPQLTLNTYRELSSLPGLSYPPGTPSFPKRDTVVSHLQEFVEKNALEIEHGVEALSVTRQGDHFLIVTGSGEFHARNVVMAVGRDTVPAIPKWKGLESFEGEVIHAADFGDARRYAGRSVLLIGGGNSGFDILNHLSRVATGPVWFCVRRGPSVLPKRLFRFAVHRLSPLMAKLPTRVTDRLIALTQFLAFGDLTRLGFPASTADAATRLAVDHIAIPIDDGAIKAVRKGRITVVPEVVEFTRDTVKLDGGQEVRPEVVIAAVGYASSLAPLVGTLGVLDEEGYPIKAGKPGTTAMPGLWFMGMTPSLTSFFQETRREAEAIARAIG